MFYLSAILRHEISVSKFDTIDTKNLVLCVIKFFRLIRKFNRQIRNSWIISQWS